MAEDYSTSMRVAIIGAAATIAAAAIGYAATRGGDDKPSPTTPTTPATSAPPTREAAPSISVTPWYGPPGTYFTVYGKNWHDDESVVITWENRSLETCGVAAGLLICPKSQVSAGTAPGVYTVSAYGQQSTRKTNVTFQVTSG